MTFRSSLSIFRPWLAVILCLGLGACSDTGSTPADTADTAEEASVQRYEARGLVRQLAKPPGQELQIHHEEIPTFVNMDGEVVGMGSMAMPFPLGDTELPADLQPGDKVSFEFEVSWTGSPPMRLLSLEKLPADTVLDFEAQDDAQDGDGDEGHEGHDDAHEGHEGHEGHSEEEQTDASAHDNHG